MQFISFIFILKFFFTFISCLQKSWCSFHLFIRTHLMNWYFCFSLICKTLNHCWRFTTIESEAKNVFIISQDTSFKTFKLQWMLICVKIWVSSSLKMSLLRKVFYTLNWTLRLIYTLLKISVDELCLIT